MILSETTLNKVPYTFVFVLILLLGLPLVAINYGMDFGILEKYDNNLSNLTQIEIRGYFRQVLLQWSAFSMATITVIFAFTQYRLTNDYIALVIGFSIFFSGVVEALHTIMIDGISSEVINKENLDAVIWTFTNFTSSVILLVGLIMLLAYKDQYKIRAVTFGLLSSLLVTVAFTLIYYVATIAKLPTMWFPDQSISRPYEISYLVIYAIILLVIYPSIYKKYRNILTNCIFYMAITQIAIALYLMSISSNPYDSGFNIAYFLKIVVYLIPFSCLMMNYIFSYRLVLNNHSLLAEQQKKLSYIAWHDELTGLYNRRQFVALLEKNISNCSRTKDKFTLLFIDIDNFKTINDNFGHAKGDNHLKLFSKKLSNLISLGDILGRIGGDEFALIMPDFSSRLEVEQLAKRILNKFQKTYSDENTQWITTLSIGIAIFPDDGANQEQLLKSADLAMYQAKNYGKNSYFFYSQDSRF